MFKFVSFTALGLLAVCLTLFAPSASHAQYYGSGSYGGYGLRGYGGYGYPGSSGFGYRSYRYSNYGYGGYGYGGYGYGRRAIVHPERLHWTPYRGWHTHGHLHVPHRGHYHTYRY
jgi:hypothetical protein